MVFSPFNPPIPPHLLRDFVNYLRTHDDPCSPAGEWVDYLEAAAAQFMSMHRLAGAPIEAVGQYIAERRSGVQAPVRPESPA